MGKQNYRRSLLISVQRRLGKEAGNIFASAVRVADGLRHSGRLMSNIRNDFYRAVPFSSEQDTIIRNTGRQERERIIGLAERFVQQKFDLLGGQVSYTGGSINWHRDFKSGYEWNPAIHSTRIPIYADHPGSDIKVPWELSRGHHFVTLGLAYRLTGDRRYFAAYSTQTDHWIAANPVSFGVNWVCSMDVAIRAVNWLAAGGLFQDMLNSRESAHFRRRLLRSLWHHGIHLSRNPEWRGPQYPRGNHFAADLAGLFALGILFRNCRTGAGWLSMSHSLLEQEIRYQVLEDGVHHERSTAYHRMVYEMFLFCGQLGARTGLPFSEEYRRRLSRMEDFLLALLPVGAQTVPQIGDNDDGRLLHPLLSPADNLAGLFPGIAGNEKSSVERFLLAGEWSADADPVRESRAFPDGGFYVMKTGRLCAVIRAGPLGEQPGHAHCDQLALTLNIAGRDILTDRGSGVYSADAELRNRFRSTASHNTVRIGSAEQNGFDPGLKGLFSMKERTRTRILRWIPDGARMEFSAEHTGYQNGPFAAVHRRTVVCCPDENRLRITDHLLSAGPVDAEWFFHVAPDVEIRPGEQGRYTLLCAGLAVEFRGPPELAAEIRDVRHSPGYGRTVNARCLCFSLNGTGRIFSEGVTYDVCWDSDFKTCNPDSAV